MHATVGEAVGLIHDLPEAATVIRRTTAETQNVLRALTSMVKSTLSPCQTAIVCYQIHTMPISYRSLKTLTVSALAVVGLCLSAQAQAPLDVRIALVIGNSAYAGAPLVNPANDARAMSETLRGLGFTVVQLRDAQKMQMADAIAKVRDSLKGKQGVGMLYHAGHGLQLDWHNYMVPVDARMSKAADVAEQAVDINTVIDAFKGAGNRMNILVLDACRDNPFAGTTTGKGLAQLDAPPGTFLAYATAPGNVAEDGDVKSGNGLYTQFLLEELKRPVAKIEDVFKRVRLQVRQKSQGRQIPWESTSLEDDFFFNTGKVMAVAKPDEKLREVAFNTEKSDWDKVKDSKNATDLYAFLLKYPNGNISELALAQLERLDRAKTIALPDRNGETQSAVALRFRLGDTYEFAIKDGLTGVAKTLSTAVVTAVTDGRVELTGIFGPSSRGAVTVAGAIISTGGDTYDPPFTQIPGGEYQVGKKWSGRSNRTSESGKTGWMEYQGHIQAYEKVEVAAGTFDAYKIQMDFQFDNGLRRKTTFWAQPDWGLPMKMVIESRPRSGSLDVLVREMLSRRRTNS